jgi:hypothetical protein
MRATAMAAAGLMLVASGALAQGVPAQNEPSSLPSQSQPATEGRSIGEGTLVTPRAPIGHRQPTMRDLPPDVARSQQLDAAPERPAARDIDPDPRICRGC